VCLVVSLEFKKKVKQFLLSQITDKQTSLLSQRKVFKHLEFEIFFGSKIMRDTFKNNSFQVWSDKIFQFLHRIRALKLLPFYHHAKTDLKLDLSPM
jgi:hypothetical protein